MKAKTIIMILEILKQNADGAYKDLEECVEKLNEKYVAINVYPLKDTMEEDMYDHKVRTYEDAIAALNDFESHEWN